MASFFGRFLVVTFLLILPLSASALYYGQSKEEVVAEIGDPNGKRQLSNGELWVYSGDVSLEFNGEQLVRARGTDLLPPPVPEPAPQPKPAVVVPKQEPETAAQTPSPPASDKTSADADEELLKTAESISSPESVKEAVRKLEESYEVEEQPSRTPAILRMAVGIALPTIIQWILLIAAFKWVGAEALKSALLLIAVTDRIIILSVRWFFIDFMTYPTTFQAEHLASFIVMLGMITTLTHARQLPQAIKVVIASKVAGVIVAYLLFLLVLHGL